ncbi:MAG: hypothetical protein J0I20_28940 [Chloroflexi bacterium]|nr:hypothetical protein [Chloroflexota bacterium]OJV96336.1 MAG: hypothetical protein BGO39_01075 [Chloroflexi bacterium 54-19]
MELKERSQKVTWGLEPASLTSDDNIDNIDSIEIDETELLPASPPTFSPGDAEFLADEVYIELNRLHQTRLQAARAAARPPVAPKAAPPVQASRPAPPPPPAPVAKAAPRRSRGLVQVEEFKGDQFPILPITGMPPIHYELITDEEHLKQAVEALKDEPVLSVDTETSGLDPYEAKLLLVQVASPQMCYIIDAVRVPLDALKPLLENEKSLKLLQNAKFDYEMIKQNTGITLNNLYDTMLAERLLTAGLGMEVNLAAITKRYLGEVMDKSVRKTFYGQSSLNLTPEQLAYAAKDVIALFPIYAMQLEKLKKEKLLTVADLEFKCVQAVGDLELNGCKLDVVKWRKILEGVAEKRDAVRTELMELLPSGGARQSSMFGGDEYLINLNSGPQIIAEFGRLGITLEDTSEATLSKHNHPAAKKLLEYRGHEKTLGSFGEGLLSLISKKTGRIHPDFIQYGADTGRFSCSNPNVQQIPATSDFRACFIAEPGYKLVTCDYSQAELRILAELSLDEGFVNAFRSGGDLHILAASQMFGIKPEEVTKTQRSQAKAINFGLAYGMGPQGLALRIDKTVEEARELINAYFKAFSGVAKWLEKAGRDSVKLGYSPTPLGRKRYYHIPDSSDPDYRRKVSEIERRGKNAPIQGANADMTKMALVFLREKLSGYDARVVNTVHDEIVVEVREDQAEEVCKLVEHEMIRAAMEVVREVPMVADAKVGDYWSK